MSYPLSSNDSSLGRQGLCSRQDTRDYTCLAFFSPFLQYALRVGRAFIAMPSKGEPNAGFTLKPTTA